MPQSRPVVVLTVPFGAAHTRTAEAITHAWSTRARAAPLRVVGLGDYLPPRLVTTLVNGYLALITKAPWAFRFAYARGKRPGVSDRGLAVAVTCAKLGGQRLARFLGETAGVWVSTHPLTSVLCRAAGMSDALLSILVTDHHFHPFWCMPGTDRYFVGRPEMRKALIARGVSRSAVDLTGIPIDPRFGETASREDAEHRLGLPAAPFRALLMGGGLGIGPIEEVVAGLRGVDAAIHTVVVAGSNRRLLSRLSSLDERIAVFGFTERIHDLMTASDICITKPGGLTLAETASVGLPTLLVDPLPGHEEANQEVLVREGSAFRVSDAAHVADIVAELAKRPRLVRRMGRRIRRHGRPQAARDVADILEGMWMARFSVCEP
ncbi:hypothetical protein JXA88_03275 [Candidatus Fermentibacteria bacterium]|nr:hypothetical protein [Candidatus Fermentibacteria bacterium]